MALKHDRLITYYTVFLCYTHQSSLISHQSYSSPINYVVYVVMSNQIRDRTHFTKVHLHPEFLMQNVSERMEKLGLELYVIAGHDNTRRWVFKASDGSRAEV